jgi:outer membrane protein assembly factor BamB
MFDPFTGDLLLTLANASRGRITMSPNGDMLVYVHNAANKWLAMWNSSYAQYNYPGTVGSSAWQWRPPIGTTQDWKDGIQWNVTIPELPVSRASLAWIGEGVLIAAFQADINTLTAVGYDTTTGSQKWAINITSNAAVRPNYFIAPIGNGVFTFFKQETMEFYAYSIETGELVWGPTEPYDNSWGMFTSSTGGLGGENPVIAYNTLYAVAYDGKIHAFDITTGDSLWEFWTGSSGFETPYGTYPLGSGTFAVADGKIYAATGEHSPCSPMWRGGRIYAVDAYSGKGIWNLTGWWQNPAVADGYLTAFNNYDSHVYCIGKGLTSTTVSVQNDVIADGNSVIIKGTVTDQSPGDTCLGVPAAGTPAISDEDMTEWMEYLYMQQPYPEDATGVKVHLAAIDPNGNLQEIGNSITDLNGNFGKMWSPDIPGEYKIIATFEGSKSYYSSEATTYIAVTEAPSPAQPIEPEPTEPAEAPFITTEVAILLAAVIVAVTVIVGFWFIRKRK